MLKLKEVVLIAALIGAVLLPSSAFPRRNGITVGYAGHKGYSMFTRLVFNTGRTRPESFKIGYDEVGRKVVFAPEGGSVSVSFRPVHKVDATVRDIDYIEVEQGRLGIVIRLGKGALGLRVSYLYNPNRLVLDIYRQSSARPFMPVNRGVRTVAIDLGHGGASSGAVGKDAVSEADVMYDVSVRLKALLEMDGFKVVLTRGADKGVDSVEREGLANSEGADLFLSLHAAPRSGRGSVTIYTVDEGELDGSAGSDAPLLWSEQSAVYLPESLKLANKLAGHLRALGGGEPAVRNVRLAGFEGLAMPAVMVEFGGLSGGGRGPGFSDDAYLDRIAGLLENAVVSYAGGTGR